LVGLAEREAAAKNWGRAEELLAQCPEAMRGWEYYYLKRLRHAPALALSAKGYEITFSPDGRLLACSNYKDYSLLSGPYDVKVFDAYKDYKLLSGPYNVMVWDAATGRQVVAGRGH